MTETKTLTTKQKLQKARVLLQKKSLTKSGENKFANFKYFQLSDFLPSVNEIFDGLGLFSEFNIKDKIIKLNDTEVIKEVATLIISDNDNQIEFTTPSVEVVVKGANEIQALGSKHTYLKRYLYLNALEIVEDDSVDATIGKNKEEPKETKAAPKATEKQIELIKTLYTDKELKEMMVRIKISKIEEITIQQASKMIAARKVNNNDSTSTR